MNKLLLTGFLTAGAAIHNLSAQTTAGQGNQQKDEQRPNILFILSDDHTSQAWGIYGGVLEDYAYNNNIRRLANEGVVLDNCFCTNSISAPSRASILTGLYSHRNGLYTLADSLNTSSYQFTLGCPYGSEPSLNSSKSCCVNILVKPSLVRASLTNRAVLYESKKLGLRTGI